MKRRFGAVEREKELLQNSSSAGQSEVQIIIITLSMHPMIALIVTQKWHCLNFILADDEQDSVSGGKG